MKVKVINRSGGDLPFYATPQAAGMDLRAAMDQSITLGPLERAMVPTGLYVELPVGYEMQIRPRSGLAAKHGVTVLNTPGTIDADYRGEIKVALHNNHPVVDWEHPSYDSWHDVSLYRKTMTIVRGDRVCQLVVVPVETVECVAVDKLDDSERGQGGFGSSGVR